MLSNPRGLRGMSSIMTMKSWVTILNSSADIPEVFKDHFYQREEGFPYTVYIPANSTLFKKRDEILLSLYDDSLRVLENSKDGVKEINCSFKEISYMENSSMLMIGRLRIYGGTPLTLTFNTMGDKIFNKIIETIRRNKKYIKNELKQTEEAKGILDFLKKSNLKYLNSAREILMDDDKVLNVLFQPEIRKKIEQKRGEKTISEYIASHVTILTSNEIIHIRENKTGTKEADYGTVSLIIPLGKISNLKISKDEEEIHRLIVDVKGTHNLEFFFDIDNKTVDRFIDMCSDFLKRED